MSLTETWLSPYTENLAWFKEHLETLRTHAHSHKVNVSVYVTRAPPQAQTHHLHGAHSVSSQSSDEASAPSSPITRTASNAEKQELSQHVSRPTTPPPPVSSCIDPEKKADVFHERHTTYTASNPPPESGDGDFIDRYHYVKAERPDVASLVQHAVTTTPNHDRVLVAACGPPGLMCVVRNTTAKLIRADGPGVELHCEQFGW
jgi:hypothetical protein